jgi:hypothetical protein
MTDNFTLRQAILDRLGSPEPELPGVMFMGTSSPASMELLAMFDDMCMRDLNNRAVLERAITKLEQIRERDWEAFSRFGAPKRLGTFGSFAPSAPLAWLLGPLRIAEHVPRLSRGTGRARSG